MATFNPLLQAAEEVERIVWAFAGGDNRRHDVLMLASRIRSDSGCLVAELEHTREEVVELRAECERLRDALAAGDKAEL